MEGDYFKTLFASEDVGVSWQGGSGGGPIISQVQNEELRREVTEDEVRKAVFEINPSKCSGPDGMTGFFYQHFWETSGKDVTEMVKEFSVPKDLKKGLIKQIYVLYQRNSMPTSLWTFDQ